MRSINVKDSNGKSVILFVNPDNGKIVNNQQLELFLPCIKRLNINSNISVDNNKLLFTDIILDDVVSLFNREFKDKVIVTQLTDIEGSPIHHRVLNFSSDDEGIIVKYTTLGEFNNFEACISYLS